MNAGRRSAALVLALLCLAALSGCTLRAHSRTVILPTPTPMGAVEEGADGAAFTVRDIDQYSFETQCMSPGGLLAVTPVGWENDRLYVMDGVPERGVTLRRVDVRYGFYEVCAELEGARYNGMSLAPDGQHLLYDVVNLEDESIDLYLYEVDSGESRRVVRMPYMGAEMGISYCWAQSGDCFFYWLDERLNWGAWEAELDWYAGEIYPWEMAGDALMASDLPVNQVRCMDVTTGEQRVAAEMEQMFPILDYALDVGGASFAYHKQVCVADDGRALMVRFFDPEWGNERWIYVGEDGQADPVRSEYYSGVFEGSGAPRQILGDQVLGLRGDQWGEPLPVICRGGSSTFNLMALRGQYRVWLTPDGEHLLTVESSLDAKWGVYLYPLDEGHQPSLAGRRLLYQSAQEIVQVYVAPDQEQVVLLECSGVGEEAPEMALVGMEDAGNARGWFTVTVLRM